jgi:hypothetical protein
MHSKKIAQSTDSSVFNYRTSVSPSSITIGIYAILTIQSVTNTTAIPAYRFSRPRNALVPQTGSSTGSKD